MHIVTQGVLDENIVNLLFNGLMGGGHRVPITAKSSNAVSSSECIKPVLSNLWAGTCATSNPSQPAGAVG